MSNSFSVCQEAIPGKSKSLSFSISLMVSRRRFLLSKNNAPPLVYSKEPLAQSKENLINVLDTFNGKGKYMELMAWKIVSVALVACCKMIYEDDVLIAGEVISTSNIMWSWLVAPLESLLNIDCFFFVALSTFLGKGLVAITGKCIIDLAKK